MTTPFTCQVLCLLIKNRTMLYEWNKYCPWAKYCEHWCRFSLQFPCFQQFEQCIPWIIQSRGQFGSCTVTSGEIPSPPHVQPQPCPRTGALWPHGHIHSSKLAEGVGRQRQNQLLSPHRSSEGTQEAATAWHCLQAVWFWKARKTSCTFFYWTPRAITPSAWLYQMRLLNTSSCQPFSHSLEPPTINLLLLKCLQQKGRNIKMYLTLKKFFQNFDFDSVFWGAQKSRNLTKKFHSPISRSSQDIITISLL